MRTIALITFLLTLATPTLANGSATPDPGLRYRVSGVAQNDRLNLRAQPEPQGQIVGTLAPDARDIIVTGQRQASGGSQWWRVVYPSAEGGAAWANSRFLKTQPSDGAPETNYPLQCGGTEPFWNLQIKAGQAKFSLLGAQGQDRTFTASDWLMARGLRDKFAIRLNESSNAEQSGYAAVVRDAYCSDNMSDTLYPFNNVVILPDGTVYGGCCHRVAP